METITIQTQKGASKNVKICVKNINGNVFLGVHKIKRLRSGVIKKKHVSSSVNLVGYSVQWDESLF